ncbi:hypothetical protein JCM10449v2_003249 [Rhodotorula kratochvilovae]
MTKQTRSKLPSSHDPAYRAFWTEHNDALKALHPHATGSWRRKMIQNAWRKEHAHEHDHDQDAHADKKRKTGGARTPEPQPQAAHAHEGRATDGSESEAEGEESQAAV